MGCKLKPAEDTDPTVMVPLLPFLPFHGSLTWLPELSAHLSTLWQLNTCFVFVLLLQLSFCPSVGSLSALLMHEKESQGPSLYLVDSPTATTTQCFPKRKDSDLLPSVHLDIMTRVDGILTL